MHIIWLDFRAIQLTAVAEHFDNERLVRWDNTIETEEWAVGEISEVAKIEEEVHNKHNREIAGPGAEIEELVQEQIQRFLKKGDLIINNKLKPLKLSKPFFI